MSDQRKKLETAHRRFILTQVAAFIDRPTTIAERLGDAEFADLYGFEPITITAQSVHKAMRKIDPNDLTEARKSWLNDYTDVPLAFKKNRLKELQFMYECAERPTLKLQILKQISDEIGEDVDKLADAIRASGGDNIVNVFQVDSPDEARQAARNIGRGLLCFAGSSDN